MTTKKPTTRRRKPTSPSLRVTSIDNGDGTTTVHPIRVDDTPTIARALLDAAAAPTDVTTVTSPHGWRVPTPVAKKAGVAP